MCNTEREGFSVEPELVIGLSQTMCIEVDELREYVELVRENDPDMVFRVEELKSLWENSVRCFRDAKAFLTPVIVSELQLQDLHEVA